MCIKTLIALPDKWNIVQLNGAQCLLGINTQTSDYFYQLFAIDLQNREVWLESKQESEMIEYLNSQGFFELDTEKLKLVAGILAKNIYDEKVEIIDMKIAVRTKSWKWEFKLQKDPESLKIWTSFILKQYEAMELMLFQLDLIVDLIRKKDHYIRYLSENYKFINGDELIRKYEKLDPDAKLAMNAFDEREWQKSCFENHTPKDYVLNIKSGIRWVTKPKVDEGSNKKDEPPNKKVKIEDDTPELLSQISVKQETPKTLPRKRKGIFRSKKKT